MASPKLGLALAGGAGILVLILGMKKASAKPSGGGSAPSGPSASDKVGYAEAQVLQGFVEDAADCLTKMDSKCARSIANKMRNYDWQHADIAAAAKQEANNVDAMAKDIEDYKKSQKAGSGASYGPSDDWNIGPAADPLLAALG